jgi:hypothetical protein
MGGAQRYLSIAVREVDGFREGLNPSYAKNILRNLIYLSDPACVSRFSGKRRCEPARDGVFGLIESKKPKAEGERICVVVCAPT